MRLLVPTISVIAMTVAACLAVLGYRFARLPGWRDQRWFWLLGVSASLYTGFNVFVTLDVPEWLVLVGSHGNWASLALHLIAWNLHSAAHFHTRPGRLERGLIAVTALIACCALLPGVLVEPQVVSHRFLGITYREPPSTLLGTLAVVPLYAAFLLPLGRFLRHARQDRDARRYAIGLVLLAAISVNDRRERRPQVAARVVFVTGGVTDDAARRFLEAQPQPVLYKPVDLITVERAVDEVSLSEVH